MDTQELLKTPSQDSMEVDDGLAQKMLAALEESEGKFQNALKTRNTFVCRKTGQIYMCS